MTPRPWTASFPDGMRWDAPLALGPVDRLLDTAAERWPQRAAIDAQFVLTATWSGATQTWLVKFDPAEVHRRFLPLTGCSLAEGWGMTETSPSGTVSPMTSTQRVAFSADGYLRTGDVAGMPASRPSDRRAVLA